MKPSFTPKSRRIRARCLAWILAHRPRRYWLCTLDNTPQAVASRLAVYAGQLAVIALLSLPIGAAFAIYF